MVASSMEMKVEELHCPKRVTMPNETYRIFVSKDYMKFNAAHFIAFHGFRERLHGHNYRMSVTITGTKVGHDGYLMDFGDIKTVRYIEMRGQLISCPYRLRAKSAVSSTSILLYP
ncbi:hypothetical protein AC1031_016344 [Aphanomyces cochlioides]|nr:hypothetical protein AC1031_016344 [Aphanomyces cochlioides]